MSRPAAIRSANPVQLAWTFPGLFVLLWSTGFVGAKLGLPYAEPATFLVIRFTIVLALLLPLAWLTAAPWPASRAETLHMALAGVLLQAGYLGGVFASIHHGMAAGVSALIVGVQPIVTAVLGAPILGERTSGRQWTGLGLGLVGVLLVVWDRISLEGLSTLSILLSLLALASISVGTVYQKRFCPDVDLRTGAAIQFMAAVLVLAPIALLFETREVAWTAQFVLAMAWLVLVLSIGAIFLLFYLIRHGAATRVASLFYLVPPCTALVAYLVFGETYTALAAAGMGLAVLAVYLVTQA